ncbi:hypothetical protein ACR0YZ_002968 [Enterococcus faecalis]
MNELKEKEILQKLSQQGIGNIYSIYKLKPLRLREKLGFTVLLQSFQKIYFSVKLRKKTERTE